MDKICLNYFIDGFVTTFHDDLIKFVQDSKVKCYFYAKHNTVKPHYHWYIEGPKLMNKLRTFVCRKKKNTQRGIYAMAQLKTTIYEYGSYVCYKPESSDLTFYQITDDDIEMMKKRSEDVKSVIDKKKDNGMSIVDRVIRDLPYENAGGDEKQFNRLIDWMIDHRQWTHFNRMKIKQIYVMWVMDWCKRNDIERYREFRHASYKSMWDQTVENGHIKYYLAI